MTENDPRTGPMRDVPPPRPVEGEVVGSGPGPDTSLGAAARALAGAAGAWRDRRETGAAAPPPGDEGARTPGAFLGDLLSAAAPRLPMPHTSRLRAVRKGRGAPKVTLPPCRLRWVPIQPSSGRTWPPCSGTRGGRTSTSR